MLYFFSLLLAAVSVLYEFTLAQWLTIFHGSTLIIYFTCIGLYTFFLGMGALHYSSIDGAEKQKKVFFISESLLILNVIFSPFLIFLSASLPQNFLKYVLGFFPVVLMSFFSGIELPFLLSQSEQKRGKDLILFLDFLGMSLSGALFSLFFLESLGLVKILFLSTILNSFLLIFISYKEKRPPFLFLGLGFFIFSSALLYFETSLLDFFGRFYVY